MSKIELKSQIESKPTHSPKLQAASTVIQQVNLKKKSQSVTDVLYYTPS